MAAGEAIDFGVDSMGVPFIKEAGVLFAFYAAGIIAMAYLAVFHIPETKYFQEEEVTIPKHIQEEHEHGQLGVSEVTQPGKDASMVEKQVSDVTAEVKS